MTTLVLPKERFSPIDFFLEQCNPKETKGIVLTNSAYMRMQEDPYIRLESTSDDDTEKWIGEEITINGKYYPPLTFYIHKTYHQSFGYKFFVSIIHYGSDTYYFDVIPDVLIDYEA